MKGYTVDIHYRKIEKDEIINIEKMKKRKTYVEWVVDDTFYFFRVESGCRYYYYFVKNGKVICELKTQGYKIYKLDNAIGIKCGMYGGVVSRAIKAFIFNYKTCKHYIGRIYK